GVGKTSLGQSIADAMGRKFVRVSLGGIRDEAEIRGHRKTYVAAMPGRIITALSQAGSANPVMLLDEIDKLCSDMRGDPASALLEVLDGEQNKNFRDHFVEMPFDLSNVMFIATANTLDTIPRPLLDRMEIIELSTYTKSEKLNIARNHLMPKQLKRHGLTKSKVRISDEVIGKIIDGYTRESGVRNLEREIATVCRKAVKKLMESEKMSLTVSKNNLSEYLGPIRFIDEKIEQSDLVGVVNGLAYTSVGGDVLKIEAAIMDGNGKIELTGTLGDVMKESAHIAVSYIRSNSNKFGISADFMKNHDLHIHVPEGATPKDGPSAGVTMVSALVSLLTNTPARSDAAMTGEVTLTGRVLPIGGLKEKATAAWNMGIKRVIIPEKNMVDIEELDAEVKSSLTFIPCKTVDQVIKEILVSPKKVKQDTNNSDRSQIVHIQNNRNTHNSITAKNKDN
ncbi:MAG: endopeptidase La, partial [Clostridia bacterium]|nr:endopeptidase La [Clostridia bacterium]